jgi:hypothetical protein
MDRIEMDYDCFAQYQLDNKPAVLIGNDKWWKSFQLLLLDAISNEADVSSTGERRQMTFHDFVDMIKANSETLYAKDWHIDQAFEDPPYIVPLILEDDWLNWYCKKISKTDDYSFVYLGGENSFTGTDYFH